MHFSKAGYGIIACARRVEMLRETQALGESGNFSLVEADIATQAGRDKVASTVRQVCPSKLNFLVHNAGVLGAVAPVDSLELDAYRSAMTINVEAPLFLTQLLLGELEPHKSRILHIGSGAAHSPMHGWAAYNISKAAFFMLYRCLDKELRPKGILTGSVKPGIVETEMQQTIRRAKTEDMEDVGHFQKLKDNMYAGEDAARAHKPPADGLDTVENVAHFVEFLLLHTSDDEFGAEEWSIRDERHHARWIK